MISWFAILIEPRRWSWGHRETFQVQLCVVLFFFSSRRRHTRFDCDWSSDVCSSDLVSITAVAPADTVNRVVFRPEGLTFGQPALLTLFYGNCKVTAQSKQVAYTSDLLAILQYVPSSDAPSAKVVTGLLSHFSNYAVAW